MSQFYKLDRVKKEIDTLAYVRLELTTSLVAVPSTASGYTAFIHCAIKTTPIKSSSNNADKVKTPEEQNWEGKDSLQ